jgi:hypothetical protein
MLGQGRVSFNNTSTFNASDTITVSTYNQGSSGGLAGDGIGGDKYAVQLVWVAGSGLNQAQFNAGVQHFSPACTGVGDGGSASQAFFVNTGPVGSGSGLTGAGFFEAGPIPNPIGTGMPVGWYTCQVYAWYNVGFSTWAAAAAAGKNVGISALFNVNATPIPAPLNNTVFQPFSVQPIPEPSSLALAGLGVVAMLLIRRKK